MQKITCHFSHVCFLTACGWTFDWQNVTETVMEAKLMALTFYALRSQHLLTWWKEATVALHLWFSSSYTR